MPFAVYAMRHRPTGKFYIGSTTDLDRRIYQWRGEFARAAKWIGSGGWRPGINISRRVLETSMAFEEYEFLTLETLPAAATADDAAYAENRAIVWAAKVTPALLLNTIAGTARDGVARYPEYRAKMPAPSKAA